MNRYRYVEDNYDASPSWQCLKCKRYFTAYHDHTYRFCPYCGTEWDGRHECKAKWDRLYADSCRKLKPYRYEIQRFWFGRNLIEPERLSFDTRHGMLHDLTGFDAVQALGEAKQCREYYDARVVVKREGRSDVIIGTPEMWRCTDPENAKMNDEFFSRHRKSDDPLQSPDQ